MLIEGSAALLLRGSLQHRLAHQLVAAVQENILIEPDGRMMAPSEFLITLHPDLEAYWLAHASLLNAISRSLQDAAREYGIYFFSEPSIRLSANPALAQEDFTVTALGRHDPSGHTAAFPMPKSDTVRNSAPRNAFLIVDGSKVFPLNRTVINIGRRSDNQLVLPDPRVSRAHAQLRAVKGQYVIFDLNSTGGTFLNGQRIHQQALKPGDVISLSGVLLIYGEDAVSNPDDPGDTGSTRTLNTKTPPPPEIIE